MIRKYFLYVFLFISTVVAPAKEIYAQSEPTYAFSSPLGVYVFTGTTLGNEAHPIGKNIGYRIERKADGESDWKTLSDISAPETFGDLKLRFASAINDVAYPTPMINIPLDKIWAGLDKYHLLDSLPARGAMLSTRIAVGAMYLDRTAKLGTQYEYKISELNMDGPVKEIHSQKIVYQLLKAPLELYKKARATTDSSSVHLLWHKGDNSLPTWIYVYKKTGFGDFINSSAAAHSTYLKDSLFYFVKDTIVKANIRYSYYLQPIDYYGNPGAPSDTMAVQTLDPRQITLPDHIHAQVVAAASSVTLSWKFKATDQAIGIRIFRSESIDGRFVRIGECSTKQFTYTDQTIIPDRTYYYSLRVINTKGDESEPTAKIFAVTESDQKPFAPFSLIPSAEKDGVHLDWHSADHNIKGFYVFRGEGIHAKLSRLSGLIESTDSIASFIDTDRSLSPKSVYSYAVKALSSSNIEGNFSDTARVQPKGKTTPPAPFKLSAISTDNSIKLFWDEMRSADPYVVGYQIYRSEQGEDKFERIGGKDISAKNNNFTDSVVKSDQVYEYYIRTIDAFGGLSDNSISASASITKKEITLPPTPKGLTAEPSEDGILLSWGNMIGTGVSGYKLYRHENDAEPVTIATLPAVPNSYNDASAKIGIIYWYSLTSLDAEKIESPRSSEIRIRH